MYLNALMDSADTFSESGFENLPKDSSFPDRLLYGLKIAGIGMLTVFAVLVVLCLVLYIFKLYYNMNQKKSMNANTETSAAAPVINSTQTASITSPATDEDEQTIVAIATAAIAASRNVKDAAFKVLSIKKIN